MAFPASRHERNAGSSRPPDRTAALSADAVDDRIGRTARVGKDGDAVSFACEGFVYSLPEIEAFIGYKIPVEAVREDCIAKLEPPVKITRPPPRGGGRGKPGKHPGNRGGGNRRRAGQR